MYLYKLLCFIIVMFFNRPDEVITPKDDPIVQEISDVLREWSLVWKRLYAVSFNSSFSIGELYTLRNSIVPLNKPNT